ncbi:MAG: EI24 domain-containing protein [Paracoccaceae bacterium]
MTIFQDFQDALAQLSDRKFQRIFWRALSLTILALIAVYIGFTYLIDWIVPDTMTLPWVGEIDLLSTVLEAGALIAMFALSAFLMFPVAAIVIGFFLEDIAEAVEAKHYPHLPTAKRIPLGPALVDSLKFMGLLILVNALALLIYLVSTVFAPFVFWAVNGFLLGREYFQLVAARRIGMKAATNLRKKHFAQIWLAGILMAIPLSVPVINLMVPFLGVAVLTHQFHRLKDHG